MIARTLFWAAFLAAIVNIRRVAVCAEPLPSRALARIGDHRFYHGDKIQCAVLSADGRRVASGGGEPSRVILWDAATGERLREWSFPSESISGLAFSPDGKRLAVAISNEKSRVLVYEVETGKPLWQRSDFKEEIYSLQFISNSKRLGASELFGPIHALDAATGKELRLWKPPTEARLGVEVKTWEVLWGILSPDEKNIIWEISFREKKVGANSLALEVRDAVTDKRLYQRKLFLPNDLLSLHFTSDGKNRIAQTESMLITQETATGKELARLNIPNMFEFALEPTGERGISYESNNRVRLLDLKTGKPLRTFDIGYWSKGTSSQLFSADGKTVLLPTCSTVRLFDTKSGAERISFAHRNPVTPRFSADGRMLFTACIINRCRWDVSAWTKPALLAQERRKDWELDWTKLSGDERLFFDCPKDRVRVRETATGRVRCVLAKNDGKVHGGVFSPDNKRLLIEENRDKQFLLFADRYRLFDTETGKMLSEIDPVNPLGAPHFSPNGRLLAWPDNSHIVHLHDAATGKEVRTLRFARPLPNKEDQNASLFFSPDGEYLMVAGWPSNLLRLFHVASGREIFHFYADPVKRDGGKPRGCTTWSPDGRLLAVSEYESPIVRVLEIASGKVRAEFAGHRDGVYGLAFSPDGQTLASGGEDNLVFLWDVTGAKTLAAGKKTTAESWHDLASEDTKRAGDALADLLRKPQASVAFLQEKLHRIEAPDEKKRARLLADLDSEVFEKREAASRELARFDACAEPALRRALSNRPSLEARRRIESLLSKLEWGPPPETLRILRALEVLEHIGTSEARRCLEALAKGAAESRQTREAKRALDRLTQRDHRDR